MKKKKILVKSNGKKIDFLVNDCNFVEMGRGLTFRRLKNAPVLLFNLTNKYKDCLTAFFVFFSFFVVWIDSKNNVLEVKKINPWTFHIDSKTKWSKIIEIPISKKYRREINFFRRCIRKL